MIIDYQENYADGLAGAGMQSRVEFALRGQSAFAEAVQYEEGFIDGSLDRKPMLAKAQPA
jgi:hypothetical protein